MELFDKKVLVIAEAGVNHNGDIALAKKLIDAASDAGADIVKFQTFHAEKLASGDAMQADYQIKNTQKKESQLEMLKKLELSYKEHLELVQHCKEKNIRFLSTPFDFESIEELERLGIDVWKIPSGEITNYPYLVRLATTGKDIILSTGMSTMEEIAGALQVLQENGAEKIVLLHCNTQYPTPFRDVNLRAMESMRQAFGVSVGYSDHTLGIEVPIAAVAMGACVIEKHFTLDRSMEGPDHKASLEPQELKAMVCAIRNIEASLGNGIKEPSASEKSNISVVRKSIVAKCDILKGTVFTEEMLTTKRPGSGISPMRWDEIIGTRAIRDFKEDELIET